MSGERVERRLTAILTADVAGYSRLMGEDEAGTLARLKTLRRELIDPSIGEHKGRIVKTTGDDLLIEFPSVVGAVACAVAVQQGMAERNAGTPQGERIEFRIGSTHRAAYAASNTPEVIEHFVAGLRLAGVPEE